MLMQIYQQTNNGEYNSQNSQHFRARRTQSQGSVDKEVTTTTCARCGRTYPFKCHDSSTCCFKCVQEGEFMKEFPKNQQGNGN